MDAVKWAEDNPVATGGIILIGGLGLLWLFGFFSSSGSSSSNTAQSNMAAAYYAAEAAQTTAGTQLQIATDTNQAQTAQVGLQTAAAVAINKANADSATTIQTTQSNDALQASNNANAFAYQTAVSGNQANEIMSALNTVIPTELAYGQGQASFYLPGVGSFNSGLATTSTPASLAAQGFSQAQINQFFSNIL